MADIDTTKGKIEEPIQSSVPKPEPDPAFTPNIPVERGGAGSRTPTIPGSPRTAAVVSAAPDGSPRPLRVLQGATKFDAAHAKEFDINSLPKKPKEMAPGDKELMDDLDKAVARECESITQRVDALTEAQRAEFERMQEARMMGEDPSKIYEGTQLVEDDSKYHELDGINVKQLYENVSGHKSSTPNPDPAETMQVGQTQEPEQEVSFFTPKDTVPLTDLNPDVVRDEKPAEPAAAPEPAAEPAPAPVVVPEPVRQIEVEAEPAPEPIPEPVPEPAPEPEAKPTTYEVPAEEAAPVQAAAPAEESDAEKEYERELVSGDDIKKNNDAQTFTEVDGIASSGDLEKDLQVEMEAPDSEKIIDDFTKEVKSHLASKKKIDLSRFKVANDKKLSAYKAHLTISDISTADHPMPSAGKIVTCSGFSGPELVQMNPETSQRSRINTLKVMYSTLYQHIESPKPPTFDEWLRTTRFADLDHIFFASYKATFAGSNYIHYECGNPACRHIWLEDHAFEDMYSYTDEETEKRMKAIMEKGDTSLTKYGITRYQASDKLVIDMRNPSIYNVVLEVAGLSDEFLQKHRTLMDIIVYIDNMYTIDMEHEMLIPIDFKPEKDNPNLTIARRIKICSDMLRTLSSWEYYEFRKAISDTYPHAVAMEYHIPGTKCPKCGREIEPVDGINAQGLLFMRHQLGAFAML